MAKLPAQELEKLRGASLFTSEFLPPEGARVRNVVLVAKPLSVTGNSISSYQSMVGNPEDWVLTDAPFLKIFHYDHKWFVESGNPTFGFDDSDFYTVWNTPTEAVNDVLDFFFGDKSRMEAKEREPNGPR